MKGAFKEPMLDAMERANMDAGRWFSALSPSVRHDILRHASVRRFRHGELIAARGDSSTHWMACAAGAVRVCSTSRAGKQWTLDYLHPGWWFGEVSMFDGDRRTHDVFAHGETSIVQVAQFDLRQLLSAHRELYGALMQLQARRIRELFSAVEDLHALPMRARLAKLLLRLARRHTFFCERPRHDLQIGLGLAQEEIGQLLGASRQRVNEALKYMERCDAIRVGMCSIVVVSVEKLASMTGSPASRPPPKAVLKLLQNSNRDIMSRLKGKTAKD